jgi:hypothetical protein
MECRWHKGLESLPSSWHPWLWDSKLCKSAIHYLCDEQFAACSTTRGRVLPAVVSSSSASGGQQQRQQWLCAGVGRACVGRADMFRLQHGVAVELTQRVYDVPSLNGELIQPVHI